MKPIRWIAGMAIMALLFTLIGLTATPAVATTGGGNEDCPTGTSAVAKYNWNSETGTWVAQFGGDIVSIDPEADTEVAFWSSTTPIEAIVVKGGTDAKIVYVNGATAGSADNTGLVNEGDQTPGMSNIQFCEEDESNGNGFVYEVTARCLDDVAQVLTSVTSEVEGFVVVNHIMEESSQLLDSGVVTPESPFSSTVEWPEGFEGMSITIRVGVDYGDGQSDTNPDVTLEWPCQTDPPEEAEGSLAVIGVLCDLNLNMSVSFTDGVIPEWMLLVNGEEVLPIKGSEREHQFRVKLDYSQSVNVQLVVDGEVVDQESTSAPSRSQCDDTPPPPPSTTTTVEATGFVCRVVDGVATVVEVGESELFDGEQLRGTAEDAEADEPCTDVLGTTVTTEAPPEEVSADTLPFTGPSLPTTPLAGLGLAVVSLGALALSLTRKREDEEENSSIIGEFGRN